MGKSVWLSVFHSISAFNNAGFDLLGGSSLSDYRNNVPMLLLTSGLTICGGLGFVVMLNIAQKRRFRRFSLHTKVVLTMTVFLLLAGTLLLHVTQDGLTWMQSFFTARSPEPPVSASIIWGLFQRITALYGSADVCGCSAGFDWRRH